ncbi:MAG: hypothetical protein DWH97_11075 [Planctomycetota bacterium]|nr:MAG: hypothetical protein DWH97_11075 [Planctomycetota bacterium]
MKWFWIGVVLLIILAMWMLQPDATRDSALVALPSQSNDDTNAGSAADTRNDHDGRDQDTSDDITSQESSPSASALGTAATSESNATSNADSAPVDAPRPDIDLLGEDGPPIAPTNLVATRTPPALLHDTRTPNEVLHRIDERTIELDKRFRVIGGGRDDDPYRISWELLTSASAYIDPAQLAVTPPPWIRLLDDTVVEISGYYSTPLRVDRTKSLMLTLNRWDGCCVGLPPTPFDAIDLVLREPMEMKGLHLLRFGTFRGRMRVEVFEAAGYLIGLYRIEDAVFVAK